MMFRLLVRLQVCIIVCITSVRSNATSDIGVLLLLPKDDQAEGLNRAARLAVNQVNNSTDVLTANDITLVTVESDCAETTTSRTKLCLGRRRSNS